MLDTCPATNTPSWGLGVHVDRLLSHGPKASVPSDSNDFTARVAVTAAQRREVFRLRYEVYIAEQGKPYAEADHQNRLLSDELDEDGEVIAVSTGYGTIGTVRANWFDSEPTRARYMDVFQLQRFASIAPAQAAVCSRLAASVEHRHARARAMLFETIYERALRKHTRLCFATCAPVLARLFRSYGFREFAEPIVDPVVGKLHRTLLVLDDLEHLTRVRSPFAAIAAHRGVQSITRPWLNAIFDSQRTTNERA